MNSSPRRFALRCLAVVALVLFAGAPLGAHDDNDHGGDGGLDLGGCSPLPFPWLPPFQDALPIPRIAVPARYVTNYCVPIATNLCVQGVVPVYEMPMVQFPHRFHQLLPDMDVWGYDGDYPGPTIEAEVNQPVIVNWTNLLPEKYPDWLLANTNLHGVHDQTVHTVVHMHGSAVLPRYDGYPTNYFGHGVSDEYFYSNIDFNGDGETLWYHDHAQGLTANNVYAGLAGFYLLRNPELEKSLNLPSGKYEIPLAIQDRDIQLNCTPASLYTGNTTTGGGLPWHYHAVVNGIITPFLEVEPTRYRFRLLNGAPFRAFGLHLAVTDVDGGSVNPSVAPPAFTVIGTESGYLPAPIDVSSVMGKPGIRMMPGERIDIVIDFSAYAGTNLTMLNQLFAGDVPSPNGPFITNVMQFRVSTNAASVTNPAPPSVLAPNWTPTSSYLTNVVRTNQITLDFQDDSGNGLYPGLPFNPDPNAPGYFALINMKPFEDAVDTFPVAGDTELWEIINLTSEAHPIHIHLLDFRVVNRQRLGSSGGAKWSGVATNPPSMVLQYVSDRTNHVLKPLRYYLSTNTAELNPAQPFESGPKDVVHAAPYAVTRIVMTWPTNEIFYTTPSAKSGDTNTNGRYIYHCHILDHEDNDMMRPMQLRSPGTEGVELIPRGQARGLGVAPGGEPFKARRALRLRTQPGLAYQLEWTRELEPAIWEASAKITGSGEPVDVELPLNLETGGFFRLRPTPKSGN